MNGQELDKINIRNIFFKLYFFFFYLPQLYFYLPHCPTTLTFPMSTPRRSRRLSSGGDVGSSWKDSPERAMMVTAVDKDGFVKDFICNHALLSEYEGRQRPLAKFLTMAKVKALVEAVPSNALTTHDKAVDRKFYRYKKEPEGGDFYKRTTLPSGVVMEEFDEEFVVHTPNDGRRFACALVHDFVVEYGRKANTGDVSTSQAYIAVERF